MIVMDASVAVNISCGTEEGKLIEEIYLQDGEVFAPYLFAAEVTNSFTQLLRHGEYEIHEAQVRAQRAINLVNTFVKEAVFIPEVLALSKKYHHPAYDMFYLAIARRKGAILYTLDQKLQDIATKEGVSCAYIIDWPLEEK